MPSPPSDTHPEADRVQIELLRQATCAERFALMQSLSRMAMQCAWQAVRDAHPDLPDSEIDLLYAERLYGRDLAERLRRYLAERKV